MDCHHRDAYRPFGNLHRTIIIQPSTLEEIE
jgi:hypothetical protein